MTENEIKKEFNKLFEEIKKNRTDLKHCIEASEIRILLKIEEINERVKSLEKENERLNKKVEYLEREVKRNSILIYGLDLEEDYTIDHVCTKIANILEIPLSSLDINDFTILNVPKHPLKINLISNIKKKEIFKNCKKLKGTNIGISNDLTYNQRQDYKILKEHLKVAREQKEQKSFIRNNKLYVGNDEYTVEALKKLTNSKPVATSEPSTPTQQYISHEDNNRYAEQVQQEALKQEDTTQTPRTRNSNKKNVVKPQITSKNTSKNTGRGRLRSQNRP